MTITKYVCDCCRDTIEGVPHHVHASGTSFATLQINFDLCDSCMRNYRREREALDDKYFGECVHRLGAYGR